MNKFSFIFNQKELLLEKSLCLFEEKKINNLDEEIGIQDLQSVFSDKSGKLFFSEIGISLPPTYMLHVAMNRSAYKTSDALDTYWAPFDSGM